MRFNLAFMRLVRGKLTQRDVALGTGLSQKTLSALETGASQGIEFGTIAKLCDYLKCTPNDLFVLESEAVYAPPSSNSLKRADEIIARGLKRAMQEPEQTPEEIWSMFDVLREKMRTKAEEAEQHAQRNQPSTKRL